MLVERLERAAPRAVKIILFVKELHKDRRSDGCNESKGEGGGDFIINAKKKKPLAIRRGN